MKKNLHYGLLVLLVLQISAFAQTTGVIASADTPEATLTDHPQTAPQGCSSEGFTFQNGQLILGTQSGSFSHLYLIHNNSDYEQLLLSHPTNTAMSAGWDSRLDQGQWSALAIDRPNFVINCFGRRPGAIGYVACQSVVEVCSYTNNGGNSGYWPSENKSLIDTISSLRSMNIMVPNPSS